MRTRKNLFPIVLLLIPFAVGAAMQDVDATREPNESVWNEEADGPLPRWRAGGTPESNPAQSLTPQRIDVPQPMDVPAACQLDSPPEYSPTKGVLMRYSTGAWPAVVIDLVASLTGDPTHDEIAYVAVASSGVQSAATSSFTAAGADMDKVQFIIVPTDSIWLRDYGPHFVWQGGARGVVDSHYYPQRPNDNFTPTRFADDYFQEPSYDMGVYYSGGNFQPTANRNGFVTSLINQDNPGFSENFLGELYNTYQGIDTLHIMPKLPGNVDATGHIDMWFYLVDEDTVIISEFEPGSNATAIEITNNAVPYMEALGYEVYRVSALNIGNVHYTYTNAFRVNDRIFIPTYGEGNPGLFLERDAVALAAWQAAAGPGVEIIGINSYDIIPAAGAIHCIVMQVPRYVDSAPSACVTSPIGGEALVAGKDHFITWTASDDVNIETIDLFYSTDGLGYEPISLGEPGQRDRYRWSVPLMDATTVEVKVVANDQDANSGEAASETQFAITSALQHVYDFSSGAGTDKWARGHQTLNWSSVAGQRVPTGAGAELSSGNYAKIAVSDATGTDSDANRYQSPIPSSGWESTHIFELTIEEDPSQIVDIGFLWEGYGDQCLQMELYVWDYVVGRWCDGQGMCGENRFMDNFAGNRDDDLSGHVRSDFDRYLGPGGQLTLLLYAERPSQESFHDYLSVTVTYEACTGIDTDFDGWADACDNCPTVYSDNQNNDDGDARGNVCDCAPLDASAFEVPHELHDAGWLEDKITLEWTSDAPNSGDGTTYDVLRGVVGELPVGSGMSEMCLQTGLSDPTAEDTFDPESGSGSYYLIRGSNACGTGSYGYDSDQAERQTTACP
jgi:agmatine/peptidylarginine deiminase